MGNDLSTGASKNWFYNTSDESYEGPVSTDEVKEKIEENIITDDTLVWKEGMIDWIKISEIPEFEELFQVPKPPPLPKAEKPPALPKEKDGSNRKEQELDLDATEVKKERDAYKGPKNDKLYIEKGANLNTEREDEDSGEYNRRFDDRLYNEKLAKDNSEINDDSSEKGNAKPTEEDYSMYWYKYILYIQIPLGILFTLTETYSPSNPIPPDTEIFYKIMGTFFFLFQSALFYGLYYYKLWAWYAILIVIGLHTLIGFIAFTFTGGNPLFLLVIGVFFFGLNFQYFKKRKPIFD